MKVNVYIIAIFLFAFSFGCKKEKVKIPYELYYKMDIDKESKNQISPRSTLVIPFAYNQIYDPFLSAKKNRNSQKSGWKKGKHAQLRVIVLDSVQSKMNVQKRKQNQSNYIMAYPVIIENTAKLNSMQLPLHRGCALIVQQLKTKEKGWIDIENVTKEELGDFYYQIKPKQYIYTKTPIYKGTDSAELRIRLLAGDSNYYSNSYKSSVPNWIKRKE